MTLILKQFLKLFYLLNSETATNQIAAGVACGLILGFAPTFSLQTILVILVLFFFRIQVGAALLAAGLFKFVAFLLDPLSNQIGMAVLELPSLNSLFTTMYDMPIIPFTRFYNSIVMGAGILSVVLAVPMFFLARYLIAKYREKVVARFKTTRAWKILQATKFYQWYAALAPHL